MDKYVETKGFDLVFMQETGTSDQAKLILSNMKCVSDLNQACNRGCALFTKDCYSITGLDQISSMSKNIDTAWGLEIIKNNRYIVGSVYCKLNYVSAIDDIIAMLTQAKQMCAQHRAKGIILAGDLNARHEAWGDTTSNQYGRDLLAKLDLTEYSIIAPKTPTFLTETGSSVIDLIIVSNNIAESIETPKTDKEVELYSGAPFRGHLPITTSITGVPPRENICRIKNSLDGVDWTAWSRDLEIELNKEENAYVDLSEEGDLIKILDTAIDKVTLTHSKRKIVTSHSKPYWTPRLTTLSEKLREARKCYTKRNTDRSKQVLYKAREDFDSARKEECQNFILNKTKDLNSAEAAKFWKEFKKIFTPKKDCKVEPLEDGNGGFMSDNCDIEKELFATFFEGKHLHKENFDEDFYNEVHRIYEEIVSNRFTYDTEDEGPLNEEITMEQIKREIKDYEHNGKSADNHEFHPVMLKNFGEKALSLLHKIINLCFIHENWLWQDSEIIFLKKEGKDTYSKPGSYRPISITSYIGKLFEKIIANRLYGHYKDKGLDDPDQEGFTPCRNTGRYLNRLHLSVKSDQEQGKTSIGLFVYFEKAFDSAWKEGLIVKLAKDGVQGHILKLIIHFLTSRTVKLKVNGSVGPIRQCSDVGLPQGSALSPILFKIYLMDLAEELKNRNDVEIFKFADDGTIKASADTTPSCLETFDEILTAVHRWSYKWRMVINCNPNKSEVVCFGTAEKNPDLVPKTFKIGDKEVKRVPHTKVLGLVIDENLTYMEHAKQVYKRLIKKWAMICQYCNRHWGFTQKVIVQLIKTLFLSTLFYVGYIWINQRTMKEINTLWYKIIKTTIGAVFNIKLSVGETILGLAPLQTVNQVNLIKHYLKMNIRKTSDDRLKEFIISCLNTVGRTPVELGSALRKVFKYLKWKLVRYPNTFEEEDIQIITQTNINQFFQLSSRACRYTKDIMRQYTEHIWSESTRNQLQTEGYTYLIKPSCSALPISKQVTRRQEVQVMSLFYENNLFNSFLHRYDRQRFPSPLCHCDTEVQTSYHVAVTCSNLSDIHKLELQEQLKTTLGDDDAPENTFSLLNASRSPTVINLLVKSIDAQQDYLRSEIEL